MQTIVNNLTHTRIRNLLAAHAAITWLHASHSDERGLDLAYEYEREAHNLWRSLGHDDLPTFDLVALTAEPTASRIGKLGGQAKSPKKRDAVRANGKLGGRKPAFVSDAGAPIEYSLTPLGAETDAFTVRVYHRLEHVFRGVTTGRWVSSHFGEDREHETRTQALRWAVLGC